MQIRLFKQEFVLRWWLILITLAAFAVLIKLSFWQWQRAAEKELQLSQLANWQQQGAPAWTELIKLSPDELDGAPLQGQARWLSPTVWLVDNQIMQGRAGYDVLVPMQLAEGTPALVVNLGWLAAPPRRDQLPEVTIPASIELSGLLRSQPGSFRLGDNLEARGQWPMRVQTIEILSLQTTTTVPLFDAVFYQQETPYTHHYQPVVLSPEKHRGYALQWLLLALAVVIVAMAASCQKEEGQSNG